MYQIAIACLGEAPPLNLRDKAFKFIDSFMKCCPRPVTLMFGGYWGLMKSIIDYVVKKYSDVSILLFLPLEREDVELPEKVIAIKTGLTFKARSIPLVRSADVVVVLGGASGTILEAIAAYAQGISVVILTNTDMPSDKLREAFPHGFDYRGLAEVFYISSPEEAAEKTCSLLRAKKR